MPPRATGSEQPGIEAALIFFHHKGDDARFDEILVKRIQLLRECPTEGLEANTHHIIAENSMARRRYAHALLHNEPCLAFWRALNRPDSLGAACMQRGVILKGMGYPDEARTLWNEALEHFEYASNPHGTGSCLHELADLHRESGALGEAVLMARQAIQCFTQADDIAAVHAVEGTLGDIYRDRGQCEEARALYQRGLDYWRSRNHPRWIAKFEQCLQSLPTK
ncbi:MAG: tetratricopeptide repeat protein [Armatimonas sp.]